MKNNLTLEAIIGLVGITIASVALVIFFSVQWAREPIILETVVETQVADLLTHIPTQTAWVVTATITPTPVGLGGHNDPANAR